ncbi:MAG: precorrin-3B C(17)-methyltransferase [Eubacteriales bacterium]
MKLFLVGLGAGGGKLITKEAQRVLSECDCIMGFEKSTGLIRYEYPNAEYIEMKVRNDHEAAHKGLQLAQTGIVVALVCEGDIGIYDMAGLVFDIAQEYNPVDIEVIAGVTAACASAAVLGAPLEDDFACISLSDYALPIEVIERRVLAAAQGDFTICFYNPRSRRREGYTRKVCRILLWSRPPETVCGYVKFAGTEGERAVILTLAELLECEEIDTYTTVFVGNAKTKVLNGKMIAERG